MSIQETRISDEALTFPEGTGEASVKNRIEGHLRYHYSRGLFVHDVEESDEGYYVKVGIAYPRDVSDCRKKDNVLKMVNIGDVKTLYASPMDEGYYRMNLPKRSDLYKAFKERHDDILTILDDINQRRAAGAAIDDDEALGCQNMAALYAAGLDNPEGLIETLRKQGRLNDGQ